MGSIEERARTDLRAIEFSHSIKIQNKDEIAHFIAANINETKNVLKFVLT